jgi:hypothetical protein
MVDLPEHAAQVALLHNLRSPGFQFSHLFWVNWFTPYLFGYMLVYALAPLFGIVTASKIVVAVAVAALPISTVLLIDETGADRFWALLTIPAMYGFSYSWGFLNFLVATPIGLLFLVLVMRHAKKPTFRSTTCVALFAILLFFSHALTYLFFAAIAGLYVSLETRSLRQVVTAITPVAAAIPLAALWYLRTKVDPGAQDPVFWDLGWISSFDPHLWGGRLTGFFPRLLGVWPVSLSILLGAALVAVPFLAGARLSKRASVWTPLAVCIVVIMVGPTGGHSGWALSQRFTVFALPFFAIGLEKPNVPRPAWRAATVFLLLAWICTIVAGVVRYDAEVRGFQEVLSAMKPDQRVLSLMFMQDTKTSPVPVFVHFPAWYSATKRGVVDMNFAVFPVALVRYQPAVLSQTPLFSEWSPQAFRWREWRGDSYRYFVVHAPVDLGYRLFAWAPCTVTLVAQSGNWWLYEKDQRCPSPDGP